MVIKKYPIGTKVVFIASTDMCYEARQDDGKVGKIVGESALGSAQVYIPDSVKSYGEHKTWYTGWENVKPLVKKNQQFLFAFME